MAGDAEANYAHFCLQKLHILPSVYMNLDRQERAFLIASIRVRIDEEKENAKKLKK